MLRASATPSSCVEASWIPWPLSNTGYDDRPLAPAHAIGYKAPGIPAGTDNFDSAFAAGGLYSTVSDLARWTLGAISGFRSASWYLPDRHL